MDYLSIKAFSELTGTVFTAWEATTLRYLSGLYVSSIRKYSSDKNPEPPYMTTQTKKQRIQAAEAAFMAIGVER